MFVVRRRVFFLAAIWVLLLLVSLSLLSMLEAVFSRDPDSHTVVSVGWAGYVVSKSFNEQREVTGISAEWIVPYVNTSAGNGYSSAWIGIGGQSDKTLIQVGTEHDVLDGKEFYSAWYELLPEYAIRITEFVVNPGDKIFASIMLVNPETNEWNIHLGDVTNGHVYNRNFYYNSTCASGEWIVERALVNGQIADLANFGSLTFQDCQIDLNKSEGSICNFTYSKVHMANQQLDRLASASQLSADGASFSVHYTMSN
ncbi:MAG: G1 family endopeptidase [Candidatus Bathyarchaeota archaeon]|nr:G1 family endopeptidase [Candidatus Bathyarchaeota archaeon]